MGDVTMVSMVCWACSAKEGAYCVAGLRTDGQGWVRPVSGRPNRALGPSDLLLDVGRPVRVGDLIELPVGAACPLPHQPENVRLTPGRWRFLRQASESDLRHCLTARATGPALLGSCTDRLSWSEVTAKSVRESLALVVPERCTLRVRVYPERRQPRLVFSLAGVSYDLGLSDPEWRERVLQLPVGDSPVAATGLAGHTLVLCVSLTDPYDRDGCCYKVVAGVLPLPRAMLAGPL